MLPLLLACVYASPTPVSQGVEEAVAAEQPAPPVAPQDAIAQGSCNVCHAVPVQDVPVATRQESCSGCHIWIQDIAADPAKRQVALEVFPLWERYERTVHSYLQVPSLEAAMARLDPEWVAAYLNNPHDLRPMLPETMPRMDLSEGERAAIAALFASAQTPVASSPTPTRDNLGAGEELFTTKGCAACHSFGARHTGGIPMAPDLAHTRARMDPDRAVAWIQDPQAVSPAATMPNMGLSADEAIALRDYLYLAELDWTPTPSASVQLPAPADRPVTWDEVNDRVFGRICAHCHMKPEWNEGRAGPGNAGGFGWPSTGVELQSCEGVASVSDTIPGQLLQRAVELQRDQVTPGQQPSQLAHSGKPGMPMGLPAIPDPDIALVLAWIDQGSPCPPPEPQGADPEDSEPTAPR